MCVCARVYIYVYNIYVCVYTYIGIAGNALCKLPLGLILDRFGPRVTSGKRDLLIPIYREREVQETYSNAIITLRAAGHVI